MSECKAGDEVQEVVEAARQWRPRLVDDGFR
jgi:hypothetical protein